MATTTDDQPLRPSNSDNYNNGGTQVPYLRLVKTQLNFFMTRMLFMQEAHADSLGAQKTRMQNSASSLNNSASKLQHQAGDGLGGYFDEEQHHDQSDELWVYNDNARMLPNSRAKSLPPIPFPPAAPESPRQVERKDGVRVMVPTHQPTDPMARKPAAMEAPMREMTLEEEEDAEEEEQVAEEEMPREEEPEPPLVVEESASAGDEGGRPRQAISPVPLVSRVFPKNQRRSKRFSSRERPQRSQSFRPAGESSGEEDNALETRSLNSSSMH
jgi:hypothetical protein